MGLRARRWILAAAVAVLVIFPPVGCWLLVRVPADATARRLSRETDEAIASYRAYWRDGAGRWATAPLRGESVPGNGAEAVHEIAAHMALSEIVVDDLARGEVSEETAALAREHEDDLVALRDASRSAFAWTEIGVERGTDVRFPEYGVVIRALSLLAAYAVVTEPGECLRIAADGIRAAQHVGHCSAFLGLVVAAEGIDTMLAAIEHCAPRAAVADRAAAAAELRALVASAPHVGCALEFEDLYAAATFRQEAASVPLVPTSSLEVEQVAHRGTALDAWEHVVRAPDRWRAFTHPRAAAEVAREDAARTATGNALLAIAIGARDRLVARDADTQSRLRALAAELE